MKILINGLGRIGKLILREGIEKFDIVAINEKITNPNNLSYVLNYDTTYGKSEIEFIAYKDYLIANGKKIKLYSKNLNELVDKFDLVIEASGKYHKIDAKNIIYTYPNINVKNIIYSVNDENLSLPFSASSCNANALYPVLKLIDENFNIISGDIVTIHPFLNHQKVLDGVCLQSGEREIDCNFEFGRSSVFNIIPSNTTTIKAISLIDKKYQNLITSSSIRVPTNTVGVINAVFWLEKKVNMEKILKILKTNKIIKINDLPLVSSDFKGEIYTIIDKRFIKVNKNMVKLTIWYDNELGYAKRIIKLPEKL